MREKQHNVTRDLSDVAESYERAEENMKKYSVELGRLKSEQAAFQRLQKEHDEVVSSLAQRYTSVAVDLIGEGDCIPTGRGVVAYVEDKTQYAWERQKKAEKEGNEEIEKVEEKRDTLREKLGQAESKVCKL